MTLEEAAPGFEVWPDCWPAVEVLRAMGTQWRRAGMAGGPVGLDYGALPFVLNMCGILRKEWPALFEDIRVMESAALEYLHKKK